MNLNSKNTLNISILIININIDKEGVYSLTIIAENSMGNSVTKEIEVVVQ